MLQKSPNVCAMETLSCVQQNAFSYVNAFPPGSLPSALIILLMSRKFALCLSQGTAVDTINPEQILRVLKMILQIS